MDPIEDINPRKDSSLAMLLEAQQRCWDIYYLIPDTLFALDGEAYAEAAQLDVFADDQCWFNTGEIGTHVLADFDVILMRKDPPFNMEFIYSCYMLDLAAAKGTLVVNNPASLRNYNEKFSILNFPQCCAPTLVTKNVATIQSFLEQHKNIVIKPLDAMGGESIFKLCESDPNRHSIIQHMTAKGHSTVMCQRFIPEVTAGDKRILIIQGEPVPYALARIPQADDFRANLAAGGSGISVQLSERDYWICQQLKETLISHGIVFAGIDVIGDYLTEINITSPTCIRELDAINDINISALLFDRIEHLLTEIKHA